MPYIATVTRQGVKRRCEAVIKLDDVPAALYHGQSEVTRSLLARDLVNGQAEWDLGKGVIAKVRDVQWRTLCDYTGHRYPGSDEDRDRIITSYNDRYGVGSVTTGALTS